MDPDRFRVGEVGGYRRPESGTDVDQPGALPRRFGGRTDDDEVDDAVAAMGTAICRDPGRYGGFAAYGDDAGERNLDRQRVVTRRPVERNLHLEGQVGGEDRRPVGADDPDRQLDRADPEA